ncbi:MAG: hypothetical protein JXR36_09640 [Bacteroidales bacterium]|nr:hypothetical protein [Bacteroidales bacterium]
MVKTAIISCLLLLLFSCNNKQENIENQKYIVLGGSKIKISDTTIIDVRVDTDYIHPDRLSFMLDLIIYENIKSFIDVKQLKFNVTCDSSICINTYPQKSILASKKIMENKEIITATTYIVDSFSNKSFEVANAVIDFVSEENHLKDEKLNFYNLVYFYVKYKSNDDTSQFIKYDKFFREVIDNYYFLVEIDEPYDKELKEILDIYQIIAPDSASYIKQTFKR